MEAAGSVSWILGLVVLRPFGCTTSLRTARWRTSVGMVVLPVMMAGMCACGAAGADCMEYGDLPTVGGVDTPDRAFGVAVSPTHAYVADYDSGLQVIDITSPANPQMQHAKQK